MLLLFLVFVLAVWMLACGYCGYNKRFGLFVIVTLLGVVLNSLWMYFGLSAHPLSSAALAAHAAVLFYAFGALLVGWFAGRLVRSFRESRVERK